MDSPQYPEWAAAAYNSTNSPARQPPQGYPDDNGMLYPGQPDNTNDTYLSDADSDYDELQADIKKLEQSRVSFLKDHWGLDSGLPQSQPSGRGGRGRGRGRRKRGPRKPAEPSVEIRVQLSEASRLFVDGQYEEAEQVLQDIIKHNAETLAAWTLLSSIYEDIGEHHNALLAKVFVAHLRPKEIGGWLAAAEYALVEAEPDIDIDHNDEQSEEARYIKRLEKLQLAKLLYSGALSANRGNIQARLGKANVCLEFGQYGSAAVEYIRVLKRRPYNIQVIRNLAEASYDATKGEETIKAAISAYQTAIAHARRGALLDDDEGIRFGWVDVTIYAELFAALNQYDKAVEALRSLSRWILGRNADTYWDLYKSDDREWDLDDGRRLKVTEFDPELYSFEAYRWILPRDLRAKLAVYRLKLGHEIEALEHLSWLDPNDPQTAEGLRDSLHLLREVATELKDIGRTEQALRYFELYRMQKKEMGEVDADALIDQARCYIRLEDISSAEDCFLAAIEADEDNVEARFELAMQYEKAKREEMAFVLVQEALLLRNQQEADDQNDGANNDTHYVENGAGKLVLKPRTHGRNKALRKKQTRRVKRLGGSKQEREFEEHISTRLKEKYTLCRGLKTRAEQGDKQAMDVWMDAAKELIDDFRSFREYYPWEKYVKFLGYGSFLAGGPSTESNPLAAMAERLQHNLAPVGGDSNGSTRSIGRQEHRGIPFRDWLEIFLEYAIGLAHLGQPKEAYAVCQSMRDSIVYKAKDSMFLIHLAWATCAIYAGDEETCVAVARYFMRDMPFTTDTYRMYAAMCRVCQAPPSWYSSGPAQKFMLRQIRFMDNAILHPGKHFSLGEAVKPKELDLCLLLIYGQILFTSTSYSYALNYFHRAISLDPDNPVVNLSVALAYIHWGMKRQADNRQYMLSQGLTFLFKYYELRMGSDSRDERQEAHFNVARTYHMIGLHPLAIQYYERVLGELEEAGMEPEDMDLIGGFVAETVYNLRTIYLVAGDMQAALEVSRKWLVL